MKEWWKEIAPSQLFSVVVTLVLFFIIFWGTEGNILAAIIATTVVVFVIFIILAFAAENNSATPVSVAAFAVAASASVAILFCDINLQFMPFSLVPFLMFLVIPILFIVVAFFCIKSAANFNVGKEKTLIWASYFLQFIFILLPMLATILRWW